MTAQKALSLVVGASGLLGQAIVAHLRSQGHPVRALTRRSTESHKVEALQKLGAEVVVGDLRDPESLAKACRGVSSVLSSATAILSPDPSNSLLSVDWQGQLELVDQARAANVEHFVYVSLFELAEPVPLSEAKTAAESRLEQSGLAYTIVRPAFFREAWLSPFFGFAPSEARVTLYGTGEQLVSYVACDDVARFCALSIDAPASRNRRFDLGGPEPMSLLEAAKTAFPPPADLELAQFPIEGDEGIQKKLERAQHPVEKSHFGLLLRYAQGLVVDNRPALTAVPMTLTPLRPFLAEISCSRTR